MADAQDASSEGSFYQRGSGLWVGSVWVQLPDGTRTRRHVSGRDEQATRAKWEALKAKAARGAVPVQAGMSVAQYLEYWLQDVIAPLRRPATYANYAHLVRMRISPQLGKVKLERLAVGDVRRWVIGMQQAGDSARMVQVARAVLRSALTNAVAEDLVERNVAMLIRVPKPPRRAIEPWSAAEAKRFLKATRSHRLHAAFTCMLMLGLRRGEALGISWNDLDLDAGTLQLRYQIQRGPGGLVLQDLKTDESAVTLPVPGPLLDVLLERYEIQDYETARPA
jgi:integrase